jgi:hypothetical protein
VVSLAAALIVRAEMQEVTRYEPLNLLSIAKRLINIGARRLTRDTIWLATCMNIGHPPIGCTKTQV